MCVCVCVYIYIYIYMENKIAISKRMLTWVVYVHGKVLSSDKSLLVLTTCDIVKFTLIHLIYACVSTSLC